jgi:hypothetical protein
MAKHTPGPWFLDDDGRIFDTPDRGQLVAEVATADPAEPPAEEDVANARLIAAAPDLLAALEKVVAISDRKHDAWDEARAAIAKAEGRS